MSTVAVGVVPDVIAAELRGDIIEQRIAPGDPVTEAAVSQRFGVARPTARNAIERLVAEGLLRREAHHAARVPRLTADDIRDLFDARALVESAALARLAGTGSVPAAAVAAHRHLEQQARAGESFAADDIAFHRALVAAQPSPRLARMHEQLLGEIELCIGQVQVHSLRTAADVARQHQGILDAVVAGRAELAARLSHEHVTATRDLLLDHDESETRTW
ncbi:MAG: GntR family transcriptional regulator [Microbacteriaceae bacterium]